MENNTKCPKCGGSFEKGILGDRGHANALAGEIEWGSKIEFMKGLKNVKYVVAYRCEGCGYLESYAN